MQGDFLPLLHDSNGGVTRPVNGHIAKIIKPYVENNKFSVLNSKQFVDEMKDVKLEEGEVLVSFDVVGLYPSIPQSEALDLIKEKLLNDDELHKRTRIPALKIMELLKICVENTHFHFNGKMYRQISGLAMGAPTSGFAADIFMQSLERRALATFFHPPCVWKRYVDDGFAIILLIMLLSFLEHLNSMHKSISWTHEVMEESLLAYIDAQTEVEFDRSLSFKFYRKPTHTNQYLNFDSNHHIGHRLSVVKSMNIRAETLITKAEDINSEKDLLKDAFRRCKYPQMDH